jgi:MFS family permease
MSNDAAPPRSPVRRTWPLPISFGLVISAQVLLFAGSNLPTPLFPIYEARYGFGSGVVTMLFAVYVAALLPVLLRVGPTADRVGRRPMLVAGIAVTAASSVAFGAAQNLAWLFAGEIIYGLGAGLVMSCVAVAIRELHPRHDLAAGALAASVAAAAGLTLGPLVSGLLASATPWPTVTPYVLDVILAAVLAAALTAIPETRPATTSITVRRAPLLRVPAEIRRPFTSAATAAAASFMVGGWVLGLSASYLHEELHVQRTHPVVAGSFAALVMLTNGASQLLLRRHHSPTALHRALAGVAVGMGVMATSTAVDSLPMLVAGALIAGSSSGVAQMNAMGTVQRVAPIHARGAVLSIYFTICYLALSVPVIIAGTAADHLGLGLVTAAYSCGVIVVVATAIALSHHATAQASEPPPAHTARRTEGPSGKRPATMSIPPPPRDDAIPGRGPWQRRHTGTLSVSEGRLAP